MGITLGLLGLSFYNPNKGCMALSRSFFSILEEIGKQNNANIDNIIVFSDRSCGMEMIPDSDNTEFFFFSHKSVKQLFKMMRKMNKCRYVFDFSEGDGFSDIYGLKRMIKTSMVKILVLLSGSKLVLCPQTYGPYKSFIARLLAKIIIKNAYRVNARDNDSCDVVHNLCSRSVETYTDVAFGLPIVSTDLPICQKRIGINVSGLLWNGGYNKDNQFGLRLDYKGYCNELIKRIKELRDYKIVFIPHVYGEGIVSAEDDYKACAELMECNKDCDIAPQFVFPEQIKGFIKEMDIFIGARMHATIAAFSENVVTIPVAYSNKFTGLYSSVNYPFVIDATRLETEEAVQLTISYIINCEELAGYQKKSMTLIYDQLQGFKDSIRDIIVLAND